MTRAANGAGGRAPVYLDAASWRVESLQVRLVKDVALGWANGTSLVGGVYNGKFYFSGAGELWRSDGTEAGTYLVKDINPGVGDGGPSFLTNVNGTLFFSANDGTTGFASRSYDVSWEAVTGTACAGAG